MVSREELYTLYIDQGKSYTEIAEIHKVAFQTIGKWIKKYGIQPRERTTKGFKFPGRKLSEERKKKLSVWHTGRKLSPEHRSKVIKNLSKTWKERSYPLGTLVQNHSDGYWEVKDKEGWVYIHRHIMERIVGRKLAKDEIVHHKDHNTQNNADDNLMILDAFNHLNSHSVKYFKNKRNYSFSKKTLRKFNFNPPKT